MWARRSRRSMIALMLGPMVVCGCTGSIGEEGVAGPEGQRPPRDIPGPLPNGPIALTPEQCADQAPMPGRAPLQRLTVEQYDNTVRDLLGDETRPAQRLVDRERDVLSADARTINDLIAEQYMLAAEEVAERATRDGSLVGTLGCDPSGASELECVRRFVSRFLTRAFRRPAVQAEVDSLMEVYAFGAAELDSAFGVALVIEATLQSPNFLYRVEVGDAQGEAVVRLDDYQLATRLSYFIWRTMPDEVLLEAARSGKLSDDTEVERQVRRMLADRRAEAMLQDFFARLLELKGLSELEKDREVFANWSDSLPEHLRLETEAFVRKVMTEHEGDWRVLMSAPWTMVNDALAEYYGLDKPPGEGFVRVDLDPAHHAGMLTQGALMALRARSYETSPIHRGMFVRGTLLCHTVPDVPEGLDVTPPDPDENLTTRERLAEHRADPTCGACHAQIDPLGFAFEHFDGAGRFRETEGGLAIDATGEVINSDIGEPFDGAADLAQSLAESGQVQQCFVRRWFRYGFARAESTLDACTIVNLTDRFSSKAFDVRELVVALALSDAFLYRTVDQDSVTEVP